MRGIGFHMEIRRCVLSLIVLMVTSQFLLADTEADKTIKSFMGWLMYHIDWGFLFASAILILKGLWVIYTSSMYRTGIIYIFCGLFVSICIPLVFAWSASVS